MADLNQYSFTGRLGSDAAVKVLSTGKTLLEMSVAVNSGYGTNKKTQWIKVNQWGERVLNIVNIFKKGSLVAGTGELALNTWTGKDGTPHTDIVVTCLSVQLLQGKKDDAASASTEYPEGDIAF